VRSQTLPDVAERVFQMIADALNISPRDERVHFQFLCAWEDGKTWDFALGKISGCFIRDGRGWRIVLNANCLTLDNFHLADVQYNLNKKLQCLKERLP
jgi:hypothetical protein